MATTTTVAPAKRTLKKGSADEQLVKLLRRHKGDLTVEELAPLVVRKRKTRGGQAGEPMKPESLRSQISKVAGILADNGISEEKISEIMPKDYSTGAGRKEREAYSADDLAALLDSDDETDEATE